MDIFEKMKEYGVEQVTFNYDENSGAMAITAIHDTTLGPATGGTRMREYESTEDAVIEAMRLAQAMTYKCAAAGVNFGGGKTVLIGDHEEDKNEFVLRALGKFIDAFDGRYSTGTDMGTRGEDFVIVAQETDHVSGLPEEYGGSGNIAIPTAYGVYLGIKASAKEVYGTDSLEDKKIAVQGLGKIGQLLIPYLIGEGAKVIVDNYNMANTEKIQELFSDVEVVDHEDIHKVDCHIFSPNARGSVINDKSIEELSCDIIAGGANNQLDQDLLADKLKEKDILYAPDFVINAGGLIAVADEIEMDDVNHDRVMSKTENIYRVLENVYKIAIENDINTNQAAIKIAKDRIEILGNMNNRI